MNDPWQPWCSRQRRLYRCRCRCPHVSEHGENHPWVQVAEPNRSTSICTSVCSIFPSRVLTQVEGDPARSSMKEVPYGSCAVLVARGYIVVVMQCSPKVQKLSCSMDHGSTRVATESLRCLGQCKGRRRLKPGIDPLRRTRNEPLKKRSKIANSRGFSGP